MNNNVLSTLVYESTLEILLARMGLSEMEIKRQIAERLPTDADGALLECTGRGLVLDLGDLNDHLHARFGRDTFDDGEPLTADSLIWTHRTIDQLIDWAIENKRGRPVTEAFEPLFMAHISIQDMLAALRSEDFLTRIKGGLMLSRSLGVGMALSSEHALDVEHIRGPAVSAILGRAMSGESEACDELESLVSAEPTILRVAE